MRLTLTDPGSGSIVINAAGNITAKGNEDCTATVNAAATAGVPSLADSHKVNVHAGRQEGVFHSDGELDRQARLDAHQIGLAAASVSIAKEIVR